MDSLSQNRRDPHSSPTDHDNAHSHLAGPFTAQPKLVREQVFPPSAQGAAPAPQPQGSSHPPLVRATTSSISATKPPASTSPLVDCA